MPVSSAVQPRLKEHEQWLVALRQRPGMTLAKIRAELENEKAIEIDPNCNNPSQLETYFRHLGQRKNLSRHDWIAVFRALDSQKAFGRRCDLYISGKLITEEELKTKRKNAKPAQKLVETLADADQLLTRLPDVVTVQAHLPPDSPLRSRPHSNTPQSLLSHENSDLNHDLRASSSPLDSGEPLPQQDIILNDRGRRSCSVESLSSYTGSANQSQFGISAICAEAYPAFQSNYDGQNLGINHGNAIFFSGSGGWDNWSRSPSPDAFLRSLQFLDASSQNDLWFTGFNYASPTHITPHHRIHDLNPYESAPRFAEDPVSMISRRQDRTSNEVLPTEEEVLDNLRSLVLIASTGGESCGPFDVFGEPVIITDDFIQLLFFCIVNNFAGLAGKPAKVVITFINKHEAIRSKVLRQLTYGGSTLYTRALVEKLLEASIDACDEKSVLDLLNLEVIRPNDIVCWGYHESSRSRKTRTKSPLRLTPVEKSSILGHVDIVELLIRFGADVNKSFTHTESPSERGALERAVGLWDTDRHIQVDMKLVGLLLDNGATVRIELMSAAIDLGDAALVERLMRSLSPSEHVYCFNHLILRAATQLKNDIGHKFVRQIMQTCRDFHNNKCIKSEQDVLVEVMYKAARRNNRDLVDLLLPHGGRVGLDSALIAAARFGSHSLVRMLVSHGARVDTRQRGATFDSNSSKTTPLAEAIRSRDPGMVDLLANEGAWNSIGDPECLGAAIWAIAESGNMTYLLQVLELVPSQSPEVINLALAPAINAGHEEFALRLLEAGADPRKSRPQDGHPLTAALKIKSQPLTWALLEYDVRFDEINEDKALEAAVSWGDLNIIEALFFMGSGADIEDAPRLLELAIKARKRPIIDFLISRSAWPSIQFTSSLHCAHRRNISTHLERFSSPLAAAILTGDVGITNYLLDHGANPADEQAMINAITHGRGLLNLVIQKFHQRYPQGCAGFGGPVLLHGLQTRDEAALELCLSAGFDVNRMAHDHEYGLVTALGLAIKKYHTCPEWIWKLLDAGGDPNLLGSIRENPYFWHRKTSITVRQTAFLDAIETKSLPVVELLICKGAHVQKEAKLGLRRTPLQKACEVGSHTIVDLLLAHNADVNEAPAVLGGATALQLAAKAGSTRIAQKLLDLGAKLDAPAARLDGHSAIEFAAEYGRLDMISFLFNAAGGKLVPDQCTSAVVLARKNGHLACADLLTELSMGRQAFLNGSSMADNDGGANVSM